MTRRELRENIFKMLFRVEFHKAEEIPEQFALFEEEIANLSEKDRTYLTDKCNDIFSKVEELDAAINEVSEGWKTSRMGKVDLTVLRLAVYEILFDEEIPTGVAINEAVELAKKFGQDSSSSFVNGVLAKFA